MSLKKKPGERKEGISANYVLRGWNLAVFIITENSY